MKRGKLGKIARKYRLKAVILFGSCARGDAKPGSDCDVCVSAPGFHGDELELIGDLSEALGEDVDLCIFERIGPSLMGTVARDGKLLWGVRSHFDRLRVRGFKEWQDDYKYITASRAFLDHHLS